jgi:hypothetical protein
MTSTQTQDQPRGGARNAAGAGAGDVVVRARMGTKIAVTMAAIILVLGAATVAFVSREMRNTLMQEFESKGKGIARSLATSTVELITADDRSRIQGYIDQRFGVTVPLTE